MPHLRSHDATEIRTLRFCLFLSPLVLPQVLDRQETVVAEAVVSLYSFVAGILFRCSVCCVFSFLCYLFVFKLCVPIKLYTITKSEICYKKPFHLQRPVSTSNTSYRCWNRFFRFFSMISWQWCACNLLSGQQRGQCRNGHHCTSQGPFAPARKQFERWGVFLLQSACSGGGGGLRFFAILIKT